MGDLWLPLTPTVYLFGDVCSSCPVCLLILDVFVCGFQTLHKMAPPVYADLGKASRDVFGKGYHFSTLKLECKTKTSTGVEFVSGGSSNLDSGKVLASLETKYKLADYGEAVLNFIYLVYYL